MATKIKRIYLGDKMLPRIYQGNITGSVYSGEIGILDFAPGAAAAYSLRNLSRSYTGPVVTVRRSSDNAEASFTSAEISNGALVAFCGNGDGFVYQWWDQSGNANHAIAPADVNEPQIVGDGVLIYGNDKPALFFNGGKMLSMSEIILPTASVFLVANSEKDIANQNGISTWLGHTPSPGEYLQIHGLDKAWGFAYAGLLRVFTSNVSNIALGVLVGNASSTESYLNGNSGGTGGKITFEADKIGSYAQYTGGPYAAVGRCQELIIYPSDLFSKRKWIEGNIAWQWGLQEQLPYDHPYASSFPGFGSQTLPSDPDAVSYLSALSSADGTGVEVGVAKVIEDFIVGCKSDGIWDSIKASCILAGARTLNGALVPLAGTAPTNNNFVNADYDRKTGLIGDGATKYLDTNRALGDDPQNNAHISVYATTADSASAFAGALDASVNGTQLYNDTATSYYRANSSGSVSVAGTLPTGLSGASRSSATNINYLRSGSVANVANVSVSSSSLNIWVFARNYSVSKQFSEVRMAFYSIGEALDLEKLDNRVSRFMAENKFFLNTGLSGKDYDIDTLNYINAGYENGGSIA